MFTIQLYTLGVLLYRGDNEQDHPPGQCRENSTLILKENFVPLRYVIVTSVWECINRSVILNWICLSVPMPFSAISKHVPSTRNTVHVSTFSFFLTCLYLFNKKVNIPTPQLRWTFLAINFVYVYFIDPTNSERSLHQEYKNKPVPIQSIPYWRKKDTFVPIHWIRREKATYPKIIRLNRLFKNEMIFAHTLKWDRTQ